MPQATMAECPKCGATVRQEKLRRHINNVHGEGAKAPKPVDVEPARRVSSVRFPWRTFMALGVVALVVIGGYWFLTQPKGGGGTTGSSQIALIDVAGFGTIKVQLEPGRAPATVANFEALARAGSYNGKTFNRVCAGFVIQGGDVPGAAKLRWEYSGLQNSKYSIAMARLFNQNSTYKDTASSTFFINLGPNTNLDQYSPPDYYPYVVFGRVPDTDPASRAVVDTIALIPAGPSPNCTPNSPPVITSVTISS